MNPYRLHPRQPRRPISTLSGCAAALVALLQGAATASCNAHEVAPAPETPAPAAPVAAAAPAPVSGSSGSEPSAPSIYAFTMTRLDGTPTTLAVWAGKVLLVVNTASKCGYTPQYEGLQQLHAKYSPRGFAVLGFPSNDFGGQEPGTSREIASFCTSIYAVNFPMFEKIKVLGQERSPLYALLSDARGAPQWNFHKYLIDRAGKITSFGSEVEPEGAEIQRAVRSALAG